MQFVQYHVVDIVVEADDKLIHIDVSSMVKILHVPLSNKRTGYRRGVHTRLHSLMTWVE